MQVTDVTLTLFAWEDIPSTFYARSSGRPAGPGAAIDFELIRAKTISVLS